MTILFHYAMSVNGQPVTRREPPQRECSAKLRSDALGDPTQAARSHADCCHGTVDSSVARFAGCKRAGRGWMQSTPAALMRSTDRAVPRVSFRALRGEVQPRDGALLRCRAGRRKVALRGSAGVTAGARPRTQYVLGPLGYRAGPPCPTAIGWKLPPRSPQAAMRAFRSLPHRSSTGVRPCRSGTRESQRSLGAGAARR